MPPFTNQVNIDAWDEVGEPPIAHEDEKLCSRAHVGNLLSSQQACSASV
jgi:hypothetical protein